MDVRRSVIALAASASLAVGVSAAAAPSQTQVQGSPAAATRIQVKAAPGMLSLSQAPGGAAALGGSTAAPASQAELGAAIRALIKAIKSIPGLFSKLVSALNKGYAAFKKFWDEKVPSWVKWLVGGYSLWDIYQMLKEILGL
ncbi:MAG: hypothetical protein R2742_08580 [Micropruina glycogenica]|nr:hypothetical protein [Micropruina sp.]